MAKKTMYTTIKGYLGEKYRKSDDELINLYCQMHEFYNEMIKKVEETGLMIPYTNKSGATNLTRNPLLYEISKTAQLLNSLLKSLGLTTEKRKEILGEKGKDDFEKF